MKKNLVIFTFLICNFLFSQEKNDSIPIPKWTIVGKSTFLFNQSSFSNWASGGSNSVAININVNYDFNYKKNGWNWDNKITTMYGLSYIDEQGVRKTDDRVEYNSLLGLKAKKDWFFSFLSNFKTQYTKGFNYSKTPKETISSFFSPAYLNFGPGMLWRKSKELFINIAPASSRFTFVSGQFSGSFGVKEGRRTNFSLGFNLSSYYRFTIIENVIMENTLALYSDYLDKPQNIDLDYQINVFFKINENLSTNLGLHTIVDDDTSNKTQFKQLFGLGLNYIFHK